MAVCLPAHRAEDFRGASSPSGIICLREIFGVLEAHVFGDSFASGRLQESATTAPKDSMLSRTGVLT